MGAASTICSTPSFRCCRRVQRQPRRALSHGGGTGGRARPKPSREPHEIKVAIIGHPNVGKSTLLNRLTGKDRAIVSPIAGTTRDSIDEVIQYKGRKIRFIDTAGIRRKGKTKLMAEKLSVVMARKNIEDADIVLFMVDATEGVSGLDANIAGYAHESGRSVIILVNKWDLVASGEKRAISQSRTARIQDAKRPQDRALYEERLRYGLKFLSYAPVLFHLRAHGQGDGENSSADREGRGRAAQAHYYWRDESLSADG